MPAHKKYHTEEERQAARRAQARERARSPERRAYMRAYCRERRKSDPEYRETCRQASQKYLENLNPEVREERAKKSSARLRNLRKADPRKPMLSDAKKRAKQKGLDFDLTVDDLIIPSVCPVLGIPLEVGSWKREPTSPSLDRFDNSKGYTKDNICVISLRANALKNDATVEEMRLVLKYMEGGGALDRCS